MADMSGKQVEEIFWTKPGEVTSGTAIKITVGEIIVFNKTVPANKKFQGNITICGTLKEV